MFDGERQRISASRDSFPIADCTIGTDGLALLIGGSTLDDACLAGRAADIAWTLAYTSPQPPLLLLPPSYYARPLPPPPRRWWARRAPCFRARCKAMARPS
ncbi:hypothetical protein LP419_10410 [Massilia sp. H-1]|nr:hypothetical protein LP419_10410 [Massilia sp. H-1]